jgi:hypothetical protein
MFLNDFRQQGSDKIAKVSKLLEKEFGIKLTNGFPSRSKLERIVSLSETAIDKVKGSTTKFNQNPDYIKFLGLRDVATTMLNEGQYAKSPKHDEMKETLYASVRELMDSGYTVDEASSECMNRFRQDSRFAYDDEYVLPIVIKAAKDYMDEGEVGTAAGAFGGYKAAQAGSAALTGIAAKGLAAQTAAATAAGVAAPVAATGAAGLAGKAGAALAGPAGAIGGAVLGGIIGDKLTDSVSELVLRGLAEEVGIRIGSTESYDAIEEKLSLFAEASGKSRDSVIGFLNGLEEDALPQGIKFFGAKVAEQNKFTGARKDAIAAGKDSFEVDGKVFKITGDTEDEKKQDATESMFDDILNDMLAEEIAGTSVEEAEVVMAVRALADDLQGHVERLGRMKNEDLPAIADQMKNEFGADASAQFKQNAEQLLDGTLAGAKAGKDGIDGLIDGLGNGGSALSEPALAEPDMDDTFEPETSLDDMAMDDNEPVSAGPEDEPLGRAPVEL